MVNSPLSTDKWIESDEANARDEPLVTNEDGQNWMGIAGYLH